MVLTSYTRLQVTVSAQFAKLFEYGSCAILQGLHRNLYAEYSSFYFGGKKMAWQLAQYNELQ